MKAYIISTKPSWSAREKHENKISSHSQLNKKPVIFEEVRVEKYILCEKPFQTYFLKKWSVSNFFKHFMVNLWNKIFLWRFWRWFKVKIALIQIEFLPYSLVQWEGRLRQPKFKHLVLWVWKFEDSPNQFSNGWGSWCLKDLCIKIEFSSATLSCNLRILKSLKRGLVCASLLKKNVSLKVFFCKINSLFAELQFCVQTKEEEYKCDSNRAW